jgi:carbonic anhydrase
MRIPTPAVALTAKFSSTRAVVRGIGVDEVRGALGGEMLKTANTLAHHESAWQTQPGIAEDVWHALLDGNQRFVDGNMKQYRVKAMRDSLVGGQRPKAVIIGCSDSRVPPELIFDQSLGDLFVIRAAGNVIDAIGLGSVEYAVEHLSTRLVVVLGLDRCGAVQAACSKQTVSSPNLNSILNELRPSVSECSHGGAALVRDVVEKNALRVAKALLYRSAVLRAISAKGDLQILSARYDLLTGEVFRLESSEPPVHTAAKENAVHSA